VGFGGPEGFGGPRGEVRVDALQSQQDATWQSVATCACPMGRVVINLDNKIVRVSENHLC